MSISFDAILGSHEKALFLREKRLKVLMSNIANADTPGYKARDIDFNEALKQAKNSSGHLKTTHSNHMQDTNSGVGGLELLYRVPRQHSLDGNTVDMQEEKAAYSDNAVRYQTTLRFLTGRFKSIKGALKGE